MTQRLRLAAVGCGRVFERFYLPALRRSRDWELVAGVDQSAERLRWLGGVGPNLALAGSLDELSQALAVDAVLISSPPDTHCTLASEALGRGAHALIEKPMTSSTSESARLLTLASEAGRRVLVGFNRRFRPAYVALRDRLRGLPASSIRGLTFELRTDPTRWGAASRAGEVLEDLASHQLDLLPWLLDRPVKQVRAVVESRDASGTEAAIELRLAGGPLARCRAAHGSTAAEWLELQLEDRIIVATISGMTSASPATVPWARRYLAIRTTVSSLMRRVAGGSAFTAETFERQLASWAHVLRGEAGAICADGAAGGRCVALVEACRRSAGAGGTWVEPR